MQPSVKRNAITLLSGASFGAGLAVSGMTRPEKVIGFLDFAGRWDASLAFVMLGAVVVHFVAYRVIEGRASPLYASEFVLPARRDIDRKLVVGAALFGVGWGLGGYCPGPGVVSLAGGGASALVFVIALVAGMYVTGKLERRGEKGA